MYRYIPHYLWKFAVFLSNAGLTHGIFEFLIGDFAILCIKSMMDKLAFRKIISKYLDHIYTMGKSTRKTIQPVTITDFNRLTS